MIDKEFIALNELSYKLNESKRNYEKEIALAKERLKTNTMHAYSEHNNISKELLNNDLEGIIVKRKKYFKQSKKCPHEYINKKCKINVPENGKDNGYNLLIANAGKADCIIMENCGQVAVIDAGNPPKKSASSDGFSSVKKFIDENENIKDKNYIHTLIITHYDDDHIGGVGELLQNYYIGNIILTNQTPAHRNAKGNDNKEMNNIVNCLFNSGLQSSKNYKNITVINTGECIANHEHKFNLGNALVEIIGPVKTYNDTNDNSIVTKVTYKQTTYLFTGDMTTKSEKDLIKFCNEHNISLKADVLKVAHHGANTSSCQEFIDSVSPMISLVTNEPKSLHPTFDVASKLGTFYTTGKNGDFYIHADCNSANIETKCSLSVNPMQIKEVKIDSIKSNIFSKTKINEQDSNLIS